jgi:hypothetical protein
MGAVYAQSLTRHTHIAHAAWDFARALPVRMPFRSELSAFHARDTDPATAP